jgi:hypothetical protein
VNKFRKEVLLFLQKSTLALIKNQIIMKFIPKYLLNSLFIFLLLVNLPAISQTKAEKINLVISNGAITINGTTFNSFDTFTMDGVVKLLGKPDRVKSGYNKLHTYDNLGLVFFENTSNGRVNEVQLFFKPEKDLDFCPKSTFAGILKIESLAINDKVKLKKVTRKLKKYEFKKSLLADNSYRGEYNYIYSFIRFSSNNIGADKVSFGMKEPKK